MTNPLNPFPEANDDRWETLQEIGFEPDTRRPDQLIEMCDLCIMVWLRTGSIEPGMLLRVVLISECRLPIGNYHYPRTNR